jgi:hypothetical protein
VPRRRTADPTRSFWRVDPEGVRVEDGAYGRPAFAGTVPGIALPSLCEEAEQVLMMSLHGALAFATPPQAVQA